MALSSSPRRRAGLLVTGLGLAGLLAACTSSSPSATSPATAGRPPAASASGPAAPTTWPPGVTPMAAPAPSAAAVAASFADPLPGMPPVTDPKNLYAAIAAGKLSPAVAGVPERVYVPEDVSSDTRVIDPTTFKVVDRFVTGGLSQHVVPSWDLKTLYVNASMANHLVPIDPMTGKPGTPIPTQRPYNLYFTPDGKYAIVMVEQYERIDVLDAATMKLVKSLDVPCRGVNHADFSPNGRYFLATCEFSGQVIKVDDTAWKVMGALKLPGVAVPQDIRIAPDGGVYYVADMDAGGVWLVDGPSLTQMGFVPTGAGAHGIYPTRDAKDMIVTNRAAGSITLLDNATRKVAKTWPIPGGGSPDMGGLDASGRVFWVSGRFNSEVYAIDIQNWKLLARIPVGNEPHGVCVWPQPGRYSLGHTGNFR